MAAMKVFVGELRGNGHSAGCHVSRDSEGAEYICDVEPELPDGAYQLLVSGLTFEVRREGGVWKKAD